MGIYVCASDVMYELLFQDAGKKEASSHDFGKDIIPGMLADSRVFAYPFRDENRKQAAYWRDVGTLDAYFQTSMDLIQIDPVLNLYDREWPIHTYQPPFPPPKFVHTDPDRRGAALNSIVCQGAIVSGGQGGGGGWHRGFPAGGVPRPGGITRMRLTPTAVAATSRRFATLVASNRGYLLVAWTPAPAGMVAVSQRVRSFRTDPRCPRAK